VGWECREIWGQGSPVGSNDEYTAVCWRKMWEGNAERGGQCVLVGSNDEFTAVSKPLP